MADKVASRTDITCVETMKTLERAESWPLERRTRLSELIELLEAQYVYDDLPMDEETLTAIAEGLEQARRGEFATDNEIEAAFARFANEECSREMESVMTREEVQGVFDRVRQWPIEQQICVAEMVEFMEAQQQRNPPIDDATRAAVAEGIAQLSRGDVATSEQLEAALLRFRR